MVQDAAGGNRMAQVGYFAGDETAFAALFRAYAANTENMRQDIKGHAAQTTTPPQVLSPSNQDAQWRPTSIQVERVQSRTREYFAARDSGRLDDAYAMFAPSQRSIVPFASWRASIEAFNTRAGSVNSRGIDRITWYKDPSQGGPGVHAAVDFHSDFPNLALHCGYVAWQEQPNGTFALVREEDNVIDRAMQAKLKPGDLERIRAQFRC